MIIIMIIIKTYWFVKYLITFNVPSKDVIAIWSKSGENESANKSL